MKAPTRLRSDAQRNRDEILAVAVRAFTRDPNASLDGIAKTAGVGIGTLYRHFPTREALVEAAYRTEVEKLCALAPGLLAKHRPDLAIARFLDHYIEDMLKHGMLVAMREIVSADSPQLTPSLAMFAEAIAPMIDAGRAQGVLRADVTIDDFLTIKAAITLSSPEAAPRLAALLVDGLRHGAPAAPPTPRLAALAALRALAPRRRDRVDDRVDDRDGHRGVSGREVSG